MEMEVVTSVAIDDTAQDKQVYSTYSIDDPADNNSLVNNCMPQLSMFTNTSTTTYDNNMGVLSDVGTSLCEMLQTDVVLSRQRTESSSSTASTLAQLLLGDSIVQSPPVTSFTQDGRPVGMMASKAAVTPLQTEISAPESTVQSQPNINEAVNPWNNHKPIHEVHKPGGSSTTMAPSLIQILKSDATLRSVVANSANRKAELQSMVLAPSHCSSQSSRQSVMLVHSPCPDPHMAGLVTDVSMCSERELGTAVSQGLDESDNDLSSISLDDSPIDIQTFPLFHQDETNDSQFENGIAATDVGSLLEQFEEVAASLSGFNDEDLNLLPSEPALADDLLPMAESRLQMWMAEEAAAVTSSILTPVPTTFSSSMRIRQESLTTKADPDSEVVKLLKAKRPVLHVTATPPTSSSSPIPTEVLEKMRSSSKRKSAIMLTNAVPARGSKAKSQDLPLYAARKLQKILSQQQQQQQQQQQNKGRSDQPQTVSAETPHHSCSKDVSQGWIEPEPRHFQHLTQKPEADADGPLCLIALKEEDLGSAVSSRSSTPVEALSEACSESSSSSRRKLTLAQYKHRLQQRIGSSCSSSPINSRCSSPLTIDSVAQENVQELMQRFTSATNHIINPVDKGYFDSIQDHDYCCNAPPHKETAVKEEEEEEEDNNEVEMDTQGVHCLNTDETKDNSVLKSLLLNKNLADELKVQAEKDRETTRQNMEITQCDIIKVVDMELETEDKSHKMDHCDRKKERFSKFVSEKLPPTHNQENERQEVNRRGRRGGGGRGRGGEAFKQMHDQQRTRSRRNYRKRDHSPTPDMTGQALFDKLPNYYTALALKGKALGKSASSSSLGEVGVHNTWERDPSPDRSDPTFSKLPAYFSCFTNSTKYDGSHEPDERPVDATACRDHHSAKSGHSHTSRKWIPSHSGSPQACQLETAHRPRSTNRCYSRFPQRSYSQHSRKRRRTHSHSRSSSYSKSRSRRSSVTRYRGRRLTQHSYSSNSRSRSASRSSSSSDCSCSGSSTCSRYRYRSYSRSSSRSLSRSRSRYRSRSPITSRSRSRSDTRSRRYRRRHRSRSHSSSMENYRMEPHRHRDQEKNTQIEERRIVYIGRIPGDTTKRDLRRKFECFGEIVDVSVHLREHDDNYGFVTYAYSCDAFACVEKGSKLPDCSNYDLCFGGRRQFCKNEYADLDGNMEMEEELSSVMPRKQVKSLDFDALLRQATHGIKKK